MATVGLVVLAMAACSGPYVGAIEMNRGAFERLGVEVGDSLEYRLLSE